MSKLHETASDHEEEDVSFIHQFVDVQVCWVHMIYSSNIHNSQRLVVEDLREYALGSHWVIELEPEVVLAGCNRLCRNFKLYCVYLAIRRSALACEGDLSRLSINNVATDTDLAPTVILVHCLGILPC